MKCEAKIQTNGDFSDDPDMYDHECVFDEAHDIHACDCGLKWKLQ